MVGNSDHLRQRRPQNSSGIKNCLDGRWWKQHFPKKRTIVDWDARKSDGSSCRRLLIQIHSLRPRYEKNDWRLWNPEAYLEKMVVVWAWCCQHRGRSYGKPLVYNGPKQSFQISWWRICQSGQTDERNRYIPRRHRHWREHWQPTAQMGRTKAIVGERRFLRQTCSFWQRFMALCDNWAGIGILAQAALPRKSSQKRSRKRRGEWKIKQSERNFWAKERPDRITDSGGLLWTRLVRVHPQER